MSLIYEKILKQIPKKYHKFLNDISLEYDLIDDCKYLIHFSPNTMVFGEQMQSYPVKSVKEIINVLRNAK